MNGHVTDIERDTLANDDYRRVLYTGNNLQLVLMTLALGEEIGRERHEGHDQFIRVESGQGSASLDGRAYEIKDGSSLVIPSGVEHNVTNTSQDQKLRLYALYAPPEHKDGTVHRVKADETHDHEPPSPTMPSDAQMRMKALSRWESEGGSLSRAESPADSLDDSELRMLARIGAAALAQWSTLSATVREDIAMDVRRPLVSGDRSLARARISAFLKASTAPE
jgi:mannose-6-phosphate isomerase-like protein (cupin superfamily)